MKKHSSLCTLISSNETLTPLWTAHHDLLDYVFVSVAVRQLKHHSRISASIKWLHSLGFWMKWLLKSMNTLPLVTALDYGSYCFKCSFNLMVLARCSFAPSWVITEFIRDDKDKNTSQAKGAWDTLVHRFYEHCQIIMSNNFYIPQWMFFEQQWQRWDMNKYERR